MKGGREALTAGGERRFLPQQFDQAASPHSMHKTILRLRRRFAANGLSGTLPQRFDNRLGVPEKP
jgi:hypothetical protein